MTAFQSKSCGAGFTVVPQQAPRHARSAVLAAHQCTMSLHGADVDAFKAHVAWFRALMARLSACWHTLEAKGTPDALAVFEKLRVAQLLVAVVTLSVNAGAHCSKELAMPELHQVLAGILLAACWAARLLPISPSVSVRLFNTILAVQVPAASGGNHDRVLGQGQAYGTGQGRATSRGDCIKRLGIISFDTVSSR